MNRNTFLYAVVFMSTLVATASFAAEEVTSKPATATQSVKLTSAQSLQLNINALTVLRDAIVDVRAKAKRRSDLLDQYFHETDQWEEYYKARSKMPTTAPKIKRWRDEGDTSPGKRENVPLTFDEAYAIAKDFVREEEGVPVPNSKDLANLERQESALRKLAKKNFSKTLPVMVEVERKVDFVKEKNQFEKLLAWATKAMAKQEKEKKEAAEKVRKEAKDRAKQRAIDEEARRDKRKQEQADKVQRRWDRQAESYQLRTKRGHAKRSRNYSYPGNYYYPRGRW